MQPEGLRRLLGIDEKEGKLRKEFLELKKEDEELLGKIGEILDNHADEVIDSLCEHLLRFPETKTFFKNEGMLKNIKEKHRAYLKRLTKGDYDLKYFEERLRVGDVHNKINLPMKFYLGAYNKYARTLLPLVCRELGYENKDEMLSSAAALSKIIFLDMTLAIDAYIAAREAELKESEGKLATILNTVDEVVYVVNVGKDMLKGEVEFVSSKAEKILGYAPEEFVKNQQLWLSLIHPDDLPAVMEQTKKIFTEKRPLTRAYRINHRSKGYRWVEDKVVPQLDEKGNVVRFFGVARDVTEHKKAEEELRSSRERYKELADALPETVFEMDPEGRITFANRTGLEAFGYTQSDLDKGLNVLDVLVPQERERARENIPRLLKGEKLSSVEYTALRKDGTTFPVIVHTTVIQKNKVVGLRGVVIDITERKRAEQEIEHIASIPQMNPNPIFEVDSSGKAVFQNPATFEMLKKLGVKEDVSAFFPGDMNVILKELKQKKASQFYREIKIGNRLLGEYLYLAPQFSSVRIYVNDITERKRAEEEVRLLLTLTEKIHEAKDFNAALSTALQQVCEVTGWDIGEAWVLRPDGTGLECSAAGYSAHGGAVAKFRELSKKFTFKPGVGLPGRIWVSKKPEWIRDVTQDATFLRAEIAEKTGAKAALGAPVLADTAIIAVLVFFMFKLREEDEHLVKLISAIATQLGAAFQRKQAEEKLRKHVAELEEFHRITVGRELKMIELEKKVEELNAKLKEMGKEKNAKI